jgi:CRISPR-associated protein Cas1
VNACETGLALPDYLPARMLNEFVYCPRLFFYEWVEGVFAASADTVGGSLRHEKISRGGESLPAESTAEQTIHARSIELSSDAAGLIARIDLVELVGNRAVPVEYKSGAPRATDAGPEPWPADVAQLAAQVLVLRDNGYACDEGVLYYHATKQRVRVAIDDALLAATREAAAEARAVARAGRIPPPLADSPKCPRCSLVGICLPDETRLGAGVTDGPTVQLGLFGDVGDTPPADSIFVTGDADGSGLVGDSDDRVRRLVPARDDLRPLYVLGQGLAVGKSGNVLQVRERGTVVQEARIGEVSQVNLFGNVQLTTQALQTLCQADKDIGYFSQGAWFYGMTRGMGLKNVFLRVAQFRRAAEPGFALALARTWVASKIRNQRTLLQRNHVEPPRLVLEQLRRLALQVADAPDLASLLGMEGTAARLYFSGFAGMIKVGEDGDDVEYLAAGSSPTPVMATFDFRGRNRRPPRDPVNALLSFAYALLAKDLTITCHAVGFDPFVGYFHQPRFGRPALALDLMEEFRPLVADSAVLTAINTRMVGEGDFVRAGGAVALGTKGRGKFIRAYEQRMDALVTHPLFGYRVSYRRVLEIQARLLARVLTGEMRQYVGFETR